MVEFRMPILGADMTAGTLVEWRKQPGDRVKRGDVVAAVETDKGLIDVEVFVSGVLETLVVTPGATVPTGTVLALIREDAVAVESALTAGPPLVPPPAVAPRDVTGITPRAGVPAPSRRPIGEPVPAGRLAAAPAAAAAATAPAGTRVRISPLARKVAEQLGVDPALAVPTGPGGVVTREDIERAAAPREPTPTPAVPSPDRAEQLAERHARMRRTIGAAMARSKREVPHYYLAASIDMHRAMSWLADENTRRPVTERLLHAVLLIKAVALAVHDVPELNAIWTGDRAVAQDSVHVGVAISLRGGGLVAPALHDADRQSPGDLMRAFRDLVQRARSGGLRSSELSDPTITVTSLGEQGIDAAFGIIYPPQVAIVGFGAVLERPWVVDGSVVPRPVVTATLSADHRVSDGHRGGLFLAAVNRLLQVPERL